MAGFVRFHAGRFAVPAVAIVQNHGGGDGLGRTAMFLPLGVVLLLTIDLVFRRRDFSFLAWGAPVGLGLLALMHETASAARLISGRMCNGVVTLWVLGSAAAVLAIGFVVGLLAVVASCCSALDERSRRNDSQTEDSGSP